MHTPKDVERLFPAVPTSYWALWEQLILAEPYLERVRQELLEVRRKNLRRKNFCALFGWLQLGYENRVKHLVGWDLAADKPDILKSQEAYHCAYSILWETLPDCRHDGKDCMEVNHLQWDLYP